MRTLTEEEKERMMDELIVSIRDKYTKYPYEITIQEFADKVGRSYWYAKRFLASQVRDGKMTKRRIMVDNKSFTVYSVI